jgi:copper chaperone CopZ
VSVSIGKISGVKSVKVFLNKGLVDVNLKPGNTVKLEQIRKAILDDAFTPKNAQVVVVGELLSQSGKLHLKVAGTDEVFPVASTPHKSWQNQVGHELSVNGLISAPTSTSKSGTLQITSVSGSQTANK